MRDLRCILPLALVAFASKRMFLNIGTLLTLPHDAKAKHTSKSSDRTLLTRDPR